MTEAIKPDILVPYRGASDAKNSQDVFVFMRPDTNGVLGEKAVMSTIRNCPEYTRQKIQLIYLANVPSRILISQHIYERYYSLKIHFATHGRAYFTPHMKRAFSAYFNTPFDTAHVIGAFEALQTLSMSTEELFSLRVDAKDMCTLSGQSIKKHRGSFIVNYDIPSLLHRYSLRYDIAVMCFRIHTSYEYFNLLTEEMRVRMVRENIIAKDALLGSVFHYSYGPFDQLRDGISFLWDEQGRSVGLEQLSFARYLRERGVSMEAVRHLLQNPIVILKNDEGKTEEISIIDYTRGTSYSEAFRLLDRAIAYSSIDPIGPPPS